MLGFPLGLSLDCDSTTDLIFADEQKDDYALLQLP